VGRLGRQPGLSREHSVAVESYQLPRIVRHVCCRMVIDTDSVGVERRDPGNGSAKEMRRDQGARPAPPARGRRHRARRLPSRHLHLLHHLQRRPSTRRSRVPTTSMRQSTSSSGMWLKPSRQASQEPWWASTSKSSTTRFRGSHSPACRDWGCRHRWSPNGKRARRSNCRRGRCLAFGLHCVLAGDQRHRGCSICDRRRLPASTTS
jgi:hypothetical protein